MTIIASTGKPARVSVQNIHIFEVGQAVRFKNVFAMPRMTNTYKVTRKLPPLGNALQYRISAEGEGYERVTTQDDLEIVLEGSTIHNTLIQKTFRT
ncbi:hypothetical protein ACFOEZ_20195 [Tianweitania populi]|uniref:Uncharacterized protein n=1 Tax=Tianweitania populi TaxID=1607949 RepID=A0A8J3DR95_9HYPH|nr:hypothetical protein [Tianweitania populi]GHD21068.1 hypothetical protein GCM10016234_34350 [Tianweitania populi]